MVIKYCPWCQEQIIVNPLYKDDYDHTCSKGSTAVINEDVVDITKSKKEIANKLFGTRAANEGAKDVEVTLRGNTLDTHKTRAREVFIEGKKEI